MEAAEIARVFGVLLLVIALMVGVLHLMKRVGMPGLGLAQSGIRISGQCALGGRERLIVVQVDSRRFLLGVSPQGINNLSELDSAIAEDDQSEIDGPQQTAVPQKLMRWLGGGKA